MKAPCHLTMPHPGVGGDRGRETAWSDVPHHLQLEHLSEEIQTLGGGVCVALKVLNIHESTKNVYSFQ